jgi:hypothetical protein
MRLQLKRDETGTGFPAPDQIAIGELVINSKTGKLYTKLVDGSIIEWIGQKICFEPVPTIAFEYNNQSISNIDRFCCAGDNIIVKVDKLKTEPYVYNFSFVELTQNSATELISVSDPKFETYQETINGVVRSVRKCTIPINFSIKNTNYNNISMFKFIITDQNGAIVVEQIITLKCLEASL